MQKLLQVESAVKNPLRDLHGILRVGNTRVTLDSVIGAYQQGFSPEEICLHYPSLHLPDVYATIAFYLHHQELVDQYMQIRESQETEREAKQRVVGQVSELRKQLLDRTKSDKEE